MTVLAHLDGQKVCFVKAENEHSAINQSAAGTSRLALRQGGICSFEQINLCAVQMSYLKPTISPSAEYKALSKN